MARIALLAVVVVLVLAPSLADAKPPLLGSPGPFAGYVVQNSVGAHAYATAGPPIECILPVTYTVEMTYAPTSDVLTLTANGVSATGSGGHARVAFEAACWTQFAITVAGTQVALVAAYQVTV